MTTDRMTEQQRIEHDDAYAAMKAAGERALTCALALSSLPMANAWRNDIVGSAERLQNAIRWYQGHENRITADAAARAAEEGGKP